MLDRNINSLPRGIVLDGYRIERELGSGGFGITYLATEVESERKVAIKEYLPKGVAQRAAGDNSVHPVDTYAKEHFDWGLGRFRDEARALIRIRHPNIVLTLRLFSAHGTAYIVMDYVEGESLGAIVKRAGALPPHEIDEILPPLLDGLAAVHAAGYLHRDLKPANIYIRRADGSPVLLDFGAAREALGRETQTLSAIVTPGYSPPEQYGRAGKQRETADIYALGATLYRCVKGETPPDAPDRVSAIVMGQPDPLERAIEVGKGRYAPSLLAAIDAAMRVREDERPQTVAAFRALLRREDVPSAARAPGSAATLAVGAPPRPVPAPLPPSVRAETAAPAKARSRRVLWAALAGAAALGAAAGAFQAFKDTGQRATPPVAEDTGDARRRADSLLSLAELDIERGDLESARQRLYNARRLGADSERARRIEERIAEAEKRKRDQAVEDRVKDDGARAATFRDCPGCPEMVTISAGSFVMGSPQTEPGRYSYEGPQRTVAIERKFALGRYEVTRGEWSAFLREANHRPTEGCIHFTGRQWPRDPDRNWQRPGFDQTDSHPVVCVSWQDARAYAAWLSRKTGRKYRLPSEAEWEYAARAKTATARPWGDDTNLCRYANGADLAATRAGLAYAKVADCDDGFSHTAPVGRFPANSFGLYDVVGNVWEWTEDCWVADYAGAGSDARANTERGDCGLRAVRGSGWTNAPSDQRSAVRVYANMRQGYNYVGFRIARDLD